MAFYTKCTCIHSISSISIPSRIKSDTIYTRKKYIQIAHIITTSLTKPKRKPFLILFIFSSNVFAISFVGYDIRPTKLNERIKIKKKIFKKKIKFYEIDIE